MEDKTKTIKEAQEFVKKFAEDNGWRDLPNVDKFDHLHEELIEMSGLLRYKNGEERVRIIEQKKVEFEDGIGDLFFGVCRLANQLNVDVEEACNLVKEKIVKKYEGRESEGKVD